jgi:hypothetical protein
MKRFIAELFKDKNGCYNLRELAIALLLLALMDLSTTVMFFMLDQTQTAQ